VEPSEHPATWFHFRGDKHSVGGDIRAALSRTGIHLDLRSKATFDDHGILCFSEFDDGLVEFLRDIRRHSHGRVLALAAMPAALPSGAVWRLLDAGASDVLIWNDGWAAARQVQAKLERWITVEQLAAEAASHAQLVGVSPRWRALVRNIVEAARFSRIPILLTGESGTGKELLARLVHLMDSSNGDKRGSNPDIITLDCSTIVPELSGSELFGHERGAFTGAVSAREGVFALADGGTLFLDEIGELPLTLQTQLLRAVQEGTYKRVGGNVWQSTNFRLVCATNRNLNELVEQGKFRLDLYYRIAGWVLVTPALRKRREDILPLAHHFLNMERQQEPSLELDRPVREYLLNRAYPGNVRELRQLIRRIAHLYVGPGPVSVGDIPAEDRPAAGEFHDGWPDEQFERTIGAAVALSTTLKQIAKVTAETAIRIAIQSEKGNLQRAAKRLGVTDRALQLRQASKKTGGGT